MAGSKQPVAELIGTLGSVAASGTGTGAGTIELNPGDYNFSLWNTFVGTAQLERSFDLGVTWIPVSKDTSGAAAAYTAPATVLGFEPERGVRYRVNCTAYTSGTISYRVSQ